MTRPVDIGNSAVPPVDPGLWRDVDVVDLGRLFAMVMARKWLVAASVVVALALAIVYLNVAKYTYTVAYQVTPTDSNASSLMGSLGGLASLAGVNLPGKNDASPFTLYLETLRNRSVAAQAARDPLIMQGAFPKQWNAAAHRWNKPDSALVTFAAAVKSAIGVPVYPWRAPDAADLQKFIADNVTISEVPKKSIAIIKIDHEDPAFAARLLAAMHRAGDEELRQRSLARSTAYIEYIARQLPLVSVVEQRAALSRALSDQEKQRMIASAGVPYAADIFEPITSSPRPTWPKLVPVLALAIIAGLFIGVASAVVLGWREHRKAQI